MRVNFESSAEYYEATASAYDGYSYGYDCMHAPIFFGEESSRAEGLRNLDSLIIKKAREHLVQDASILDIGCGRGALLARIAADTELHAEGLVSTEIERQKCETRFSDEGVIRRPIIHRMDMNNISGLLATEYDLVTTIESESYFQSLIKSRDTVWSLLANEGAWITVKFLKKADLPAIEQIDSSWVVNNMADRKSYFDNHERRFVIHEIVDLTQYLSNYWRWELGNFQGNRDRVISEGFFYKDVELSAANNQVTEINRNNVWAFLKSMELVEKGHISYVLVKMVKS